MILCSLSQAKEVPVSEVSPDQLKQAVESQLGCRAAYVQSVLVHERHGGETVWNETVAIFDLAGHPTGNYAYAWSYKRPDDKRRFFAVLHAGPVTGPSDAVRAAILAEARAGK